MRETKIEDWNVFSCLNCKMDTHALHVVKKYDRVLISRKMEVNNNTDNYIFFSSNNLLFGPYMI